MPKHKFAIKYCCATHNTAILLTVTCTSTVDTELIVAFELKEWFRESPIMSCYKHSASLFCCEILTKQTFVHFEQNTDFLEDSCGWCI